MNYLRQLAKPIKLANADPGFGHVNGTQSDCVWMKLQDLEAYIEKHSVMYFYRVKELGKGANKMRGRRIVGGGSDIYVCKHIAKSSDDKLFLGGDTVINENCKARFNIWYPNPDYYHLPGNVRNFEKFGEELVRITWKSFHSHNYNDPDVCAQEPLSPNGRRLLFLAVQGHVTMGDITQMQNKCTEGISEIHKLKPDHVRYIKKVKLVHHAISDKDIRTSLTKRAELIESKRGFAEFTDEFRSPKDGKLIRVKTESGAYV